MEVTTINIATHVAIRVQLHVELEDILYRLRWSGGVIAQNLGKVSRLGSTFVRHHGALVHDVGRLGVEDATSLR